MGVADSRLYAEDAKSANMRPSDALKHWTTGGLRMPWIEPMTWAYVLLAVFVYAFLSPGWREHCKQLHWQWAGAVVARNMAIYYVFYGGCHRVLYEGTRKLELQAADVKWNPKYPELSRIAQHSHDQFWCMVSSVVSSFFEIGLLHLWASGRLAHLGDKEALLSPTSWFLLFISPFWRTIHFYAVHRLIHWSFLYKNVHYLHHRSRNTAPWSGLSMHPVESTLYFTCVLLPLLATCHPVHFLFVKLHADISPIPGHHGYAAFKGQQFHWLHHHYFECNYGSDLVPCDHLFGTYRKDSPEITRVKAKLEQYNASRTKQTKQT